MTREEAIENLKEFIDTYITCHGEEDTVAVSIDNVDVEALDMAIEALEQLTSYEQTINKLTKAISEQEPKTGYWIEDEYEMEVRCSACGEENDVCSRYCPNCGAKMIKPQERSDKE